MLSASPDFIAHLKRATTPDPWRLGFAIIHKSDNRVIGMCGFPGAPDSAGVAEVAYGIAPECQGRGYATEAAQALIEFAETDSRVRIIRAHTLTEMNASTRILQKCGFVRAGEAMDEGKIVWRWERSIKQPNNCPSVTLQPGPDELRYWGKAAVDLAADYLHSLRHRPVYPDTSSQRIRQQLELSLPKEGCDFDHLFTIFRDVILESSRHNGHPRMFGYVQSPGTGIGAIADFLASTLNANLTAWRSAPVAVEIERLTIEWIRQIVGFDPGAAGLFVSGGSMANLSALAAARRAQFSQRPVDDVTTSETARLRVYASQETHHSIGKAMTLLGFAPDCLRHIAANAQGKIETDDLVAKIKQDRAAGFQPFCVVANAGTVMTGSIDPLNELADIAQRFHLWMHVDACYGGFAVIAPSLKPLFRGLERADSIALDPHKWLYLPVDSGCVLYRNAENARATFAHDAAYTRVMEKEADEAFAYWDYGPELSRRFRALKVWMLLKGVGLRQLGRAIENNVACALHLERLVQKSDDFEMLAPVELSIFCFRYLPVGLRTEPRDEAAIDRLNEELLLGLQRDGSSYLSNAIIGGRFALRGCVLNYRTTEADMEILLQDLRRVASRL